ncbi:sushi domain-containing protein 3 isoform X2 [Denticeps clupeoides]|uniref:sushi domain-containing protein 3 isoform X2 n=1 Tax=Denticeps clupeoides TaxID=299321 RepID=UPI0010A3007E|nr:sushi domain-containing protein 3 isoform X2 [Denticeps clupeoides]
MAERLKPWRFGPLCCLLWSIWGLTLVACQAEDPMLLNTVTDPPVDVRSNATEGPTSNYTGLNCISLLPPRRGSFYVEKGTGVSLGTVLAFWCREGFQLVGSEKISCTIRAGTPQWSNYLPVCEAIPRPEDRGLRVAVLASVVSGIVIVAMSVSFIICCVQERMGTEKRKRDNGGRRREKLHRTSRRSDCWLEREDGDWETFPPPKIFHLSQQMDLHYPHGGPLYVSRLGGYENRGYQRSQESLLKAPLPGLYRSESQVYPHVVLQRVPTPTAPALPSAPAAPVYLHITATPAEGATPKQAPPTYPKPAFRSPTGTPQTLWP